MAREDDYYTILGVDPTVPDREIKRAYYRLARELHPDRAQDADEGRINAERLAVISKAYNTLKDSGKRQAYDAARGKPGAAPAATAPKPAADKVPASAGAPEGKKPASSGTAAGGKKSMQTTQIDSNKAVSGADVQSQRVLTAQKAFVKGMQLYKEGEFKKAIPFFETAAQNDPEGEPHYHMKLAFCLTKAKMSFTRAVESAERASQMDSYNMDFKLGLAEIYETVGIASKAVEIYKEILRWDADHERAKFRLKLLEKQVSDEAPNKSVLGKMFPSLFKKK